MNEPRWFVGFDWASKVHRARLFDADGKFIDQHDIKHDGAALAAFCDWLLETTAAGPEEIAVAIETPRGPVVEMLLERRFQVFSINPKQLDRFRDRFTAAGAKDDSRDADVLACSLRTDRRAFRRLNVEDPLVIQLREWSRMHGDLMKERTRLANRLRDQLWRYYPQIIKLTDDVADTWFLDLWEHVPTPAKAARVTEKTVARILKNHRIRRIDAAHVLGTLREQPITVARGTTDAAVAHISALAERLRLINQQIKQAERQLDQLCDAIEAAAQAEPGQICEQRDVAILRSCPGAGRIVTATLLGEAREPLQRKDYHALRMMSGVAPVTRRSGKSCRVVRRQACNNRLRTALYHWARGALRKDPVSAARYAQLRLRGRSHARALRSIGDRLLGVLCTLLERQELFDPDHNKPPAQPAG
jgi:transposase